MENSTSLFRWFPRILCMLTIIFISLSAFDAFAPGLSFGQQMGDFLISLVPSIVLIAILIVAWMWEFIGGILFMAIGLTVSPYVFMLSLNRTQSVSQSLGAILTSTIPLVLVGVLFIVSDKIEKKKAGNPINGTES